MRMLATYSACVCFNAVNELSRLVVLKFTTFHHFGEPTSADNDYEGPEFYQLWNPCLPVNVLTIP